ncbi:MAG: 4-(cytidine 5'-diphospho)-2-C-methyl-D-erythritol kinase [Treponemataceae bacterium]|nr:MAG: 4-(cytidine 5'-diphospho)-2-C-methyl-D-erythritol kinase [Treponemataceae bacterium]
MATSVSPFSPPLDKILHLRYAVFRKHMQKTLVADAPAKINIGLWVSPYIKTYPEGNFHEIVSIFKSVPLCDTLTVRFDDAFDTHDTSAEQNALIVDSDAGDGNDANLPADNTLAKAFAAFCAVSGISGARVNVHVTKRIPQGAGLGGGSSDAATFLRSLDTFYNTHLTDEQFAKAAAAVGSDVFFFLFGHGLALVGGRGEKVQPMGAMADAKGDDAKNGAQHIVLIFPQVHSSTREAYALVDAWYRENGSDSAPPSANEMTAVYFGDIRAWNFVNTFALPLMQRFPAIADALAALRSAGAAFVQMSGSGSAVFGVFRSRLDAENAHRVLRNKWQNCYHCSV